MTIRWSVAAVMVSVLPMAGCGGRSAADYQAPMTGTQAEHDRAALKADAHERFDQLKAALPELDWSAAATDDNCAVDRGNHGEQLFAPPPDHDTCVSETFRYAGFDGDLEAQMARQSAAATGMGWYQTMDAASAMGFYREFAGQPSGGRKYDAGNLPDSTYTAPGTVSCGDKSSSWTLTQRWLEAGQPLSDYERRQPVVLTSQVEIHFQRNDPFDHAAIKEALLAKHRYVAVWSIMTTCSYHVAG
jgi:hypothetical protein